MMNSRMLSQEEIDALLDIENDDVEKYTTPDNEQISRILTDIEQDALGEIGNISFGSSATALATLINQKVQITTPTISYINRDGLDDEFPKPHVGVKVEYTTGFSAANVLILKIDDAMIIADLMLGGDGEPSDLDFDEIYMSAIQEAMNQMMGAAATSMSEVFAKRVDISPPRTVVLDVNDQLSEQYIPDDDQLIKVSFQLKIGHLIDSHIMQLLTPRFAKELVTDLLKISSGETKRTNEKLNRNNTTREAEAMMERTDDQNVIDNAEAEVRQLGEATSKNSSVQNAEFSNFESFEHHQMENNNLDMLLDIPLQVTVELGRTKRAIKEILQLSQGSILELDKLAGEPVDIRVNQKLIAKGEVVVIDENFGVRVTDILSQSDRLKNLK